MKQEQLPLSWKAILHKYGSNALYIEGTISQPNYRLSFDLNYQGITGSLAFSWKNTENDYSLNLQDIWTTSNNAKQTEIFYYNAQTTLLLELPSQQNKLKIFHNGKVISLLSKLHPNFVKTGHEDFDTAFITIAKPRSIISDLIPHLRFLLHPSLGGSLALDTDWQDAVTTKFYLRLQLNKLILQEKEIEELLAAIYKLTKQLA
ncbi:hypothetical protein [Chitinophaga arvensicola]|uniref:Uncharacterized protein n=1 Tax=Chitinophaga arvensicola TaxID=29529 RepID=A0A1I0NZ82_9BACT|nr:hypothetical protein [Chitinophaga arvensicola]SEW06896.1 hypothetical protein SAMN04488122_0450 [Chitinophaga arvensicola]